MTVSTAQTDPSTARYALSVNGKVYGPYSLQQMRTYASEGRVTASSLISCENGPWSAAIDEPALADVFTTKLSKPAPRPVVPMSAERPAAAAAPAAPVQKVQLTAREAFLRELEGVRQLKTPSFAADPEASPVKQQGPHAKSGPAPSPEGMAEEVLEYGNFVLIFDVKSRGHGRLEEDIMGMGKAVKILPGIWLLHGPYTAGSIRNQLLHHFGTLDSFFIVDATRDKLAWFNFGPEVDSQVRTVWRRSS